MGGHTCAIISVGNELVLGHTLDTNSHWLCAELGQLGWSVVGMRVVGDVLDHIVAALGEAAASADAVLVTGGLGPTADDRTREALAAAIGEPLEERPELVAQIRERFRAINRPMRPSNLVQARAPRGAAGLVNSCGTAPGISCRLGKAAVYAMPGVPLEMRRMFAEAVKPLLLPAAESICGMRRLHLFGPGESAIGEAIRQRMHETDNPLLGTTVSEGVVTVRISARAGTRHEAECLIGEAEAWVLERFPSDVFGRDGETLAHAAIGRLRERGERLSLAESCTGGLLASAIVEVPGASDVLIDGVVSYANAAKTRLLGVAESLIREHGAVSREVACAMARGARDGSGADWGLAVTGIAGPGGGTNTKPVGTVWLALAGHSGVCYTGQLFGSDRAGNRTRAVHMALDLLRRRLMGVTLPWEAGFEQG